MFTINNPARLHRGIQLSNFVVVRGVSNPDFRTSAAKFGVRTPSDKDALGQLNASARLHLKLVIKHFIRYNSNIINNQSNLPTNT